MTNSYDVIVVGGGHAGAEAAAAVARLGRPVALVTLDISAIARMSCNPAIGGIGKGQIVREIDALGGLMGRAADATAVQFRMLNRSKGKAVWGPRCQSDLVAYERYVQAALAEMNSLDLVDGEVTDILTRDGRVCGVRLADERELAAPAVIITAGTFMGGVLHCGTRIWPGGRIEEPPAERISHSLRSLGIELGRLKTGTPARIDAASIDYDRCQRQDGDENPTPFSLMTGPIDCEQMPCWITQTNRRVHDLIRANFKRAPVFSGQITSTGPRYCPSIETKVDRFADKDSHQLFLEPEGRDTNRVYINGLSTSLNESIQEEMIHAIDGLADAKILRYAYAIEYDYAPPTQLTAALEVKTTPGLYLAGQVNGTTGYEEAAALGLMAAINAVRGLDGQEPIILRRDQAYIGVMIDDLVTKGVTEPYRMFTSRAEFRLQLRADNADMRLSPLAESLGLLDAPHRDRFDRFAASAADAGRLFDRIRIEGTSVRQMLANPKRSLDEVLASAGDGNDARALRSLAEAEPEAVTMVATDCLYAGYVARQQKQAEQMSQFDQWLIPADLDYARVPHLRYEARQQLERIRPRSLGQALRISGITPADITVLSIHLRGRN